MKKLFTILTVLLTFTLISCGNSKVDANGCYYDIEDAVKTANKKNQDIMLIITVDGDDEDSTDFMDKVVRDSNFKKDVAESYAVVLMDFSQKTFEASVASDGAKKSEKKAADKKAELIKKNTKYVTMLEVADTPVIYLLSKEQYFIKGLFYDDENRTLEGFKKELEEEASLIDEMHKMIYQTKIGTAEEKVAAIDALYQATSPTYRVFLCDLISSIKKLDPTDKSGLAANYIYEAAAIKSNKAFMENDIRGAIQAYIDAADETLLPAETRQIAMYTAAYMAAKTEIDSIPVVIGYLEKSIELAPESEQIPAIRRVIAALEAQQAEESESE